MYSLLRRGSANMPTGRGFGVWRERQVAQYRPLLLMERRQSQWSQLRRHGCRRRRSRCRGQHMNPGQRRGPASSTVCTMPKLLFLISSALRFTSTETSRPVEHSLASRAKTRVSSFILIISTPIVGAQDISLGQPLPLGQRTTWSAHPNPR